MKIQIKGGPRDGQWYDYYPPMAIRMMGLDEYQALPKDSDTATYGVRFVDGKNVLQYEDRGTK